MKRLLVALALLIAITGCSSRLPVSSPAVYRDWSFRDREVTDLLLELTRLAGDNIVVGDDVKSMKPITARFERGLAELDQQGSSLRG